MSTAKNEGVGPNLNCLEFRDLNCPNGVYKGGEEGGPPYEYLLRRLSIEPIYGRKPGTKGKVESQFLFIQRDFVLENFHHTALEVLNSAWEKWINWYNWQHRHKGLDQKSPANRYVQSLRKPTPRIWIFC